MQTLDSKLKNKSARIGIIGLGYVGLPLAVAFAEAGFHVVGVDIQKARVDAVRRGESYITDVTTERLATQINNGLLEASTDQDRLGETDAVCICVPTPLTKTKDPELAYVIRESEEISRRLHPGQLIVLESTTYPGTTREVIQPLLEKSGLKAGRDFFLAFSPERVDPGNKDFLIRNTPKIVGGVDENSTTLAKLLYEQIDDRVIPVSTPDVAEMCKIFENVFRSVNIALVNELSKLCERMGISVWEVIDAAATKPFGYMPFYPGPGIGGHCIPLDPYYLANKARERDFHTRFIELAAEINESMPYHVVTQVMNALSNRGKPLKNARVLVLGVAYKKNISDVRESPSLKLIELLTDQGADVSYNDPYVPQVRMSHGELSSVEADDKLLAVTDCVIIATDHSNYDLDRIVSQTPLVFDTRGVTRGITSSNIVRLGE